jgi:hypothetical protein
MIYQTNTPPVSFNGGVLVLCEFLWLKVINPTQSIKKCWVVILSS